MSKVVDLTTTKQRALLFWHRCRNRSLSYVFTDDRDFQAEKSSAEMTFGTRRASYTDNAVH